MREGEGEKKCPSIPVVVQIMALLAGRATVSRKAAENNLVFMKRGERRPDIDRIRAKQRKIERMSHGAKSRSICRGAELLVLCAAVFFGFFFNATAPLWT